jgi:peptidoglycan-N-acetylglucosamine deacetylase
VTTLKDPVPFRVSLTFDAEHADRPSSPPGIAERILDILAEVGARATFFVQGRWAQSQPELARRIGEDGHLVGNHSHHHAPLTLLHDDGLREDVLDGQRAVAESTGFDPRPWFRCPFGAGHDDPRVLGVLADLGYRDVFWNVLANDWEPTRTGAAIAADVIEGVRRHGDGAVVLLHSWPAGTGDAMESLLDGLRASGTSLVGVDELETLP